MENKVTTSEALQFKAKVKDWGLSHTTLEEVFMKVRNVFYLFVNFVFRLQAALGSIKKSRVSTFKVFICALRLFIFNLH